jgi:hypothetical protein
VSTAFLPDNRNKLQQSINIRYVVYSGIIRAKTAKRFRSFGNENEATEGHYSYGEKHLIGRRASSADQVEIQRHSVGIQQAILVTV